MTYDKAVKALLDAGLLDEEDAPAAAAALAQPNVSLTYPAWAQALFDAGLIARNKIERVELQMEEAARKEAEDDPDDFEQGLLGAGIL